MVPSEFPPSSADFPVDIYAALHPAFEVGGDLYDFFLSDDQTLCFVIADVSGKGAAAALFMARAKALIRMVAKLLAQAHGRSAQPAEIVVHVNDELCRDNPGSMFVTAFIATLDLRSRTLSYCNAGHTCPYVLSRDGAAISMLSEARGRLLGIRTDGRYATHSRVLDEGELLFLYTDGITEAENAAGEFFDETGLETSLRAAAGSNARSVVESVVAAVRAFAAGTRQSDDIAALGLRMPS